MHDSNSNRNNAWKMVSLVSSIGIDLVVCMLSGYWLGTLFQGWFGGSPLWIVAGIMLGFAVGVIGVIYLIKQYLGGSK